VPLPPLDFPGIIPHLSKEQIDAPSAATVTNCLNDHSYSNGVIMARSQLKFTVRKTQTFSHYESRLELHDEDRKRFFRNPSRYLQNCLRQEGLKWRKVSVSGLDRATVKRATAPRVVVVIIEGQWMHVDFDVERPSRVCEWVFVVSRVIVIVAVQQES
jgi:hypothetical protein